MNNDAKNYTVRIPIYVTISADSTDPYTIYEQALSDVINAVNLRDNMTFVSTQRDADSFDIIDYVRPA